MATLWSTQEELPHHVYVSWHLFADLLLVAWVSLYGRLLVCFLSASLLLCTCHLHNFIHLLCSIKLPLLVSVTLPHSKKKAVQNCSEMFFHFQVRLAICLLGTWGFAWRWSQQVVRRDHDGSGKPPGAKKTDSETHLNVEKYSVLAKIIT